MRNTRTNANFGSQLARAALGLLAALACGCEGYFDRAAEDAGTTDTTPTIASYYAGMGLNGACKVVADCRQGLVCDGGTCQAKGTTAENGKCLLSAECAGGLHCSWAGFCTPQPAGATTLAGACEKTEECGKGLYCKQLPASSCTAGASRCGVCTQPDASNVPSEGEECAASSQCPPKMACVMIGLSGTCKWATGKADLGATCAATSDCLAGLTCSRARKQCVPGSVLLNPDLYGGVECPDEADDALPFGALVDVPKTGVKQDFYRMPFPSDVYRTATGLDLSAHPSPGLGLLGFDTVRRVAESMGSDMTGWGQTTGAYMRFTRALDPATVTIPGTSVPKDQATVRFVNLKTGADVPLAPASVAAKSARNKYICRDWLYVHARWDHVLEPDTAYAVVVTNGVRQSCGDGVCLAGTDDFLNCPADCTLENKNTGKAGERKAPEAGRDLPTLLAEAKPGDPLLLNAWTSYAPLRAWLKANPAVKPVSATVFTTQNSRKVMQQRVAAAQAAGPIQLAGPPQLCKTGVVSQCATPNWKDTAAGKAGVADPRDCPAGAENLPYHEIHARLRLPIYQDGPRPYLTYGAPGEKVRPGALHLQGGQPALVTYENVCMALTIPKNGAKPGGGWPLVMFGHGTGGSFRSGATGMGAGLAAIKVASMAIDQPMHANRRADPDKVAADTDPGPLFYNFANPPAARGNFWQGGADNYALARWAKEYQGEQTPGGLPPITFDAGHLILMGHSQGSTTGPLALPYMAGLRGAVLSGCGGSLVYGLLGKQKPYDASVGLKLGLQDLGVDPYHPVLNLFQNYFEVSDPLLYAALLTTKAPTAPIHVLQTYGMNDSYTPPTTSRIFAAAAGLTIGVPSPLPAWFDLAQDLGATSAALPIANNVNVGGKTYTAAVVEALNDPNNTAGKKSYDGHFVAFNDLKLIAQVQGFVASLVSGTPTVPK
ncbi:MAG: hypothetical protein HY902_16470 [Deltaproteobacteria bacterium]|nr:hypothetical protein [Deltaproteobacteria bacterium]